MYEVTFKKSAVKELKKIPKQNQILIAKAINMLSSSPFPNGVRKIVGRQNLYRIRSGSYRVIYSVNEDRLVIEVVRIAHRKDVYR